MVTDLFFKLALLVLGILMAVGVVYEVHKMTERAQDAQEARERAYSEMVEALR